MTARQQIELAVQAVQTPPQLWELWPALQAEFPDCAVILATDRAHGVGFPSTLQMDHPPHSNIQITAYRSGSCRCRCIAGCFVAPLANRIGAGEGCERCGLSRC